MRSNFRSRSKLDRAQVLKLFESHLVVLGRILNLISKRFVVNRVNVLAYELLLQEYIGLGPSSLLFYHVFILDAVVLFVRLALCLNINNVRNLFSLYRRYKKVIN